jgi:endonuclease YncB( thermonuclease family)/GNAT superfamily N-acetyltransferase
MAGSDPWAAFPKVADAKPVATKAAAPQDPWADFPEVEAPKASARSVGAPTGRVHDGDTFRTTSGANARLYGVDAFELNQTGRSPTGAVVPLGQQARAGLVPFAQPSGKVTPTGASTYGRPVVTLDNNGDAGAALLRDGFALAEPKYLKGDPQRMLDYIQLERLARQNRRGAHADTFQDPASFRHGKPDPWEAPQAGKEGNSTAVFWDEPTPQAGLKPEVAKGWIALHRDPKSTADDIKAYAAANGFQVDGKDVDRFISQRTANPSAPISDELAQAKPVRVLTDNKDGVTGAALRGVADPFNVLDELGAVADTLTPGKDRENLWSSDRRFGDVYANNLDQNRAILAYDDAKHPYARFGGQLVGGLIAPGASVEGVGFAAARQALRSGATRMVAQSAGRSAVLRRLGIAGAAEGAAAGAGQGEDLTGRVQGALIGGPVGLALGVGTGIAAPKIAQLVGRPFSRMGGADGERSAQSFTDGALDSAKAGTQNRATAGLVETAPAAARAPVEAPPSNPYMPRATEAPQPVVAPRTRDPVTANTQAMDEASGLGPKSVLSFVPKTGEPGVSVINEDGQLAIAVYRDTDGVARGAAQVPLTPEARESFDGASVYVAPELRRQGIASQLYDALEREGHPIGKQSGSGDLTPDGAGFVSAWRSRNPAMNMGSETARPSIDGPTFTDPALARVPDRIDVNNRPRPLLDPATEMQRQRQASDLRPLDVLPLPSNAVGSLEEAERIAAGRMSPVRAPNEMDELGRRNIPSPRDGTKTIPKRGPLDMVTWLRTQGGIRAQGGELQHYGIDNAARRGVDFAGGENRFGPLVSDKGMNYDDAAQRAWEAGFFPDHTERPTVAEFLDTLNATHTGNNRAFRSEDLPEVDAFERARSARYDVEAAKENGAPLVQDRGQPVGLDDLDANAPPVRAYEEWGENAPTLAGNIRLDRLDGPQAISRAIAHTHARVGGFDAATRGRITQAETARLADELGMTADDLLKRRKGQAFNAEEALAARQLLARSSTDLVNMAKRMQRVDNPGDELEAAFRQVWLRHVAIQEQVAGMTAEAGRALAQFRQVADARAVDRVLPSLGDTLGGSDRLRQVADAIVDMEQTGTTPGGIAKFTAKALRPEFKDKLIELYYNSILSGPATHAANILSNTLTAFSHIPEYAGAAVLGAPRRVFNREAESILFSEVGARAIGMIAGIKDAAPRAGKAFTTGNPTDWAGKVEASRKAILGVKGSIIRTPTRALQAEDEFFKGMLAKQELYGLAVRKTASEGLNGQSGRARIAELVDNPTDEMLRQSFDAARVGTFTNPLPNNGPAAAILRVTGRHPWLKIFVPFVATPANLIKYAVKRTPAGLLMKEVRADLAAGGIRRDLAASRMALGSSIGAYAASLALQGRITGAGPTDKRERDLLTADGWQPYSYKVGDTYYSYARLDPLATVIGGAADMVQAANETTDDDLAERALFISLSAARNLANKSFLPAISDLVGLVEDPKRAGGNMAARLGGSAVPSFIGQAARVNDPLVREAGDPVSRAQSRIPGASEKLLAQRDVFGRQRVANEGLGPDYLSPINTSKRGNDPVVTALDAKGIGVGKPVRDEKWTPEQWDQFQAVAGMKAHQDLLSLVRSKSWQAQPKEEQEADVRNTITKARRLVKRSLFGAPAKKATKAAPVSDPWAEFPAAQ